MLDGQHVVEARHHRLAHGVQGLAGRDRDQVDVEMDPEGALTWSFVSKPIGGARSWSQAAAWGCFGE